MEATWLRHTLEEIIEQIRRLLDVSGCAFQVVDFETRTIHPAAAWFATDAVRAAMTPVLARPYDRERPGVTEAAIERGEALLIPRFEAWEGAGPLRERLQAELDPADAKLAWDWYRTSSFLSVPSAPRPGARSASSRCRPAPPRRCSATRTCASCACSPTSPPWRSSAPSCSTARSSAAAARASSPTRRGR